MFDPIKVRIYEAAQGLGYRPLYYVQVKYTWWPFWMNDGGHDGYKQELFAAEARMEDLLKNIRDTKHNISRVVREEAV